jgi:orotidine-5'-phosphate decarboxylase
MMTRFPFRQRIAKVSEKKKSRIVLALDPPPDKDGLVDFASRTIKAVEQNICAIKMNFHLILPLSQTEILQINTLAHSYGLQSIADIKLNDIDNTNQVAIEHLIIRMGFDAVIANPFIGKRAMSSLVHKAHASDAGIIALVYMSHPDASEGFGLNINGGSPLYKTFFDRALETSADGIVIGATQLEILKKMSRQGVPVYSPGIGAQGGNIENAVKAGADYLIIGRSIIEAGQPAKVSKEIRDKITLAIS